MCDVNGPFKLCTCDTTVDRTKPHWVLHRYIQSKKEFQMMGDFRTPNPFQKISSRNLLKRLNSVKIFDFEYEPQEGDYLELFISSEIFFNEIEPDYRLEYSKGRWKNLKPFIFTEYKHSMSQTGPIDGPVTDLTISYNQFIENAGEEMVQEFENYFPFYLYPNRTISKKGLIEFFRNSTMK
jgi:hypothetical protein